MKRLFDAYITVDWSARNMPTPAKPSPDSIWVCEGFFSSEGLQTRETYFRTRNACKNHIVSRLNDLVNKELRVFVGFDFGYGYPKGFAKALGLGSDGKAAWLSLWNKLTELIVDNEDNSNNRFEVASILNSLCGGPTPGPLWGCPQRKETETLKMKSPLSKYPYPVNDSLSIEKFRIVDKREVSAGLQPIWKLIGSGSVGGQSLVGIPILSQIRNTSGLEHYSKVWPFESGFTMQPTPTEGPFILHAEIWPGVVSDRLDETIAIKDQAQVKAMVEWLANLDESGELAPYFARPDGLSDDEVTTCCAEEGWIIGAGREKTKIRKPKQLSFL